ncbi:hypothetical protein [Muricauda brasiliensis]|uniref:hypothetical protein n=1 Tax=Muricauda brasiliensis TaxID=2162892 RepID=UPI00131ED252|nr:hypothetical protein [Muricauda brasiliensis]
MRLSKVLWPEALKLGMMMLGMVVFVGCNSNGGNLEDDDVQSDIGKQNEDVNEEDSLSSVEFVKDTGFANGIRLLGTDTSDIKALDFIYPYSTGTETASWKLAEWGSNHAFGNVEQEVKGDSIIYANKAKRVVFIKEKAQDKPHVLLEVIASEDYTSVRKDGEDWPHLLLEQTMADEIALEDMESLELNMGLSLVYDKMMMDPAEFDESLHTSQVSLYLTISDSTDFFWFGVPVFDHRNPDGIPLYAAQDLGKDDASKKFIVSIASEEFFPGSLQNSGSIDVDKDILPYIKNAFERAKRQGYLKDAHWSDMFISSFNFGWETTGTFDSGMLVRELQLTGRYRAGN